MAEPLRGILVGLGGRGRYWNTACRTFPDVELVAYVEPFAGSRETGIKAGVAPDRIYETFDQALSALNGEADFVLDVTPPGQHETVATQAFGAGLHLIGEKPLSDDFTAARRIVAAGQQAGVRHMITQNYRFGAQPRTTRRLVNEGVIGAIGQIDINFYMPWADRAGTHYVTEPYMFTKDMGIHHFDMIRYVSGKDPVSARCISWNPAWGWHQGDGSHLALFTFDNGARAVHRGAGSAVGTKTTWNGEWRIEGPGGSITWEGADMYLTHLHRTEQRRREQIFPDKAVHGDGADALLHEFVSAIREGREPECNASDNIRSLAMVEACVRSAQTDGSDVTIADLLT